MYAAAGGASCRNARRKQQQQQKQAEKDAAAARLKEKLAASRAAELQHPKSRQFHHLPDSYYLRAQQLGSGRKLSVGYTGHSSKLLLPINEQSAKHQHRSPSHQNLHLHPRHHPHHINNNNEMLRTPTHRNRSSSIMRLGVQQQPKLTKSATASFPLACLFQSGINNNNGNNQNNIQNNQNGATPPTSPPICLKEINQNLNQNSNQNHHLLHANNSNNNSKPIEIQIPVPFADGNTIFITPATPIPSPSPKLHGDDGIGGSSGQSDEQHGGGDHLLDFPLERACSVYRSKKLGENEPTTVNFYHEDDEDDQKQYEYYHQAGTLPNGQHHAHWADEMYDDDEYRICDHIECAQSKAAWLERGGRRCSVQDPNQASYHRRWVKRNRVQDVSIAGSSDDEDILGVIRGPSTFANAFLYIGLGTISLGSIIFFVGTGEKGFKTQELRLIGPSLAAIGLVFCVIRILFCICPSHCIRRDRKKTSKVDADHRTSLLRDTKRVSIAKGPYINSKIPMSSSQSSQFPPKSIVKNSKSLEGVEALRQIASTSLFLDNEHKLNGQTIPTINEPDEEPPIEMKKIDTLKVDTLNVIDIMSMTDDESEREMHQIDINQEIAIPKIEPISLFSDDDVERSEEHELDKRTATNKLNRQRTSLNQSKSKEPDLILMETSLSIPELVPLSPPPYSPPPAPLSPEIVTTQMTASPKRDHMSLPLKSSNDEVDNDKRSHHHKHRHHHSSNHSHSHSHHHRRHHHSLTKHRHSTAVTGMIQEDRASSTQQPAPPIETEIVLSPSKLGQ